MNEPIIHCLYDKLAKVKDLGAHPKNRNKHPKDQIERLAKILKYQGFRYPIKVSKRSGFITSGHGRLEAARLNKWDTVPVNFQDYESDEQEMADLTSDNAIALWAELDLSGINADLENLGPDFDIELLGLKNFTVDVAEKSSESEQHAKLADKFLVPPFSVLDARQGYWQERKRQWLALGIKSELGRGGGNMTGNLRQEQYRQTKKVF